MTNSWIEHCKEYAKKHNVSYRQALKDAKPSYKGGSLKSKVIKKVMEDKPKRQARRTNLKKKLKSKLIDMNMEE